MKPGQLVLIPSIREKPQRWLLVFAKRATPEKMRSEMKGSYDDAKRRVREFFECDDRDEYESAWIVRLER